MNYDLPYIKYSTSTYLLNILCFKRFERGTFKYNAIKRIERENMRGKVLLCFIIQGWLVYVHMYVGPCNNVGTEKKVSLSQCDRTHQSGMHYLRDG